MAPQDFMLNNVTVEDMPEIIRLQYDSFKSIPFICKKFLGCRTEEDIPKWLQEQERILREDNHDIWIKVVHKESGRLAAASNWRLYLKAAPVELDDQPPEWLEGEMKARSKAVLDEMNVERRAANPAGFLHLHSCFTHPDFQKCGAGGLMMQWGCDLADKLFLPAWVEATVEGRGLYLKYGWKDYGYLKGELRSALLRREAGASV